ncbi:hypothetical protein BC936DRAFT_147252 [Jimgerdemannia flammicorona]|uniref:Uncharacterized protein n=1 Tax=Jimgerdemannia flammicorona TaxID=994334 RepID=A0A433DL13_9FUNG|nr:hypothetical protein BC936DRAFT_147252 [Jimgerdemannia flammicorona]
MGNCVSSNSNNPSDKVNKDIDRRIKSDEKKLKTEVKLLLLGAYRQHLYPYSIPPPQHQYATTPVDPTTSIQPLVSPTLDLSFTSTNGTTTTGGEPPYPTPLSAPPVAQGYNHPSIPATILVIWKLRLTLQFAPSSPPTHRCWRERQIHDPEADASYPRRRLQRRGAGKLPYCRFLQRHAIYANHSRGDGVPENPAPRKYQYGKNEPNKQEEEEKVGGGGGCGCGGGGGGGWERGREGGEGEGGGRGSA